MTQQFHEGQDVDWPWQLVECGKAPGVYYKIENDGVRIADVFPGAGMYVGKIEPSWIIAQAKLIVNTMNAKAREDKP